MEDRDFARFIESVKAYTSIDLSQYKETQMKRRLTTLRIKRGYDTFASYFDAMKGNKALLNEFLDRMTINVSEFWRNSNRWSILADRFLPDLIAGNRNLRVWSAACSTGEEPYTLAMILAEKRALQDAYLLATDIDELALEKARQGEYSARSVREVPAVYLHKYFRQQDELVYVADDLKKKVTFKKQNLLVDSFESGFDLIVCRNVIIYFTDEAKDLLFHKFARALKPGGLLFVGSTEQIFNPSHYQLETVDTFFYRKQTEAGASSYMGQKRFLK
jgi:chemotaxis protein methyltransferase CheR